MRKLDEFLEPRRLYYQLSPKCPTSKDPTILHRTTFTLPIFTSQEQSTLQNKRRLEEKQTAMEEITQHRVLFDIYKTPRERHGVHPCERMRAGVIRTRAGMCFGFVLLYGGGIKDKCINEHLERNSLCLLVIVTASRAQTPSLTQMMWLMEGEVSVRSGALPRAAVCLGWQRHPPKWPPSHTSAGKVRENAVLLSAISVPHTTHTSFYTRICSHGVCATCDDGS